MAIHRATGTVIIPGPPGEPGEPGEPEVTLYQGNVYNDRDPAIAAVLKDHPWALEPEADAVKR